MELHGWITSTQALKFVKIFLIGNRADRFFQYDSPSQNLAALLIKFAQMLQKNGSQLGYDIWDKL